MVVVVDVVVVVVVVVDVVVVASSVSRKVPGSDTAPGPGRLAEPSTSPLPVAAMQNTEASVTLAGVPGVMGPAGVPFSVMVRQVSLPKQPAWSGPWPGHRSPAGSVSEATPVVSGERSTGIAPMCEPSMQRPPPAVQGFDGGLAPPVGQSRVSPVELVVTQVRVARGPRSHVPVPGLLGVPVAEHFGQGWAKLPVR